MEREFGGIEMENNSGGCLAVILAFSFIGGNIFLFTGALGEDMGDNVFAGLMVIGSVIADLAIVAYIIKCIGQKKAYRKN